MNRNVKRKLGVKLSESEQLNFFKKKKGKKGRTAKLQISKPIKFPVIFPIEIPKHDRY